ncbi:tetratricopeptide repeat protein [Vibrio sp.]|uniref:tetratricopeptide repeat protein n=1 Tax=Vibrio sp. TaxID=678 RepID=UPI003D14E067
MMNRRWAWFFSLWLLIPALSWANARHSSTILNEADGLAEIVPTQSKQLISNYLSQRKLSDKVENGPSNVNRDDSDSRFRSPTRTIVALQILARAEFNLGNFNVALNKLEDAERLAELYQQSYLAIDVRVLRIKLRWLNNQDGARALADLETVAMQLSDIDEPELRHMAAETSYGITILQAEIASQSGQDRLALEYFERARPYATENKSSLTAISYHMLFGQHWLRMQKYNLALSELLLSYWTAVEDNSSAQLAEVNRLLAKLFYQRQVLDKALEHLSQAADFYDDYEASPILADVLKDMGDVYFQQGRYNLALVHYFNVVDLESTRENVEDIIDVRISLAATYLQLYNFPLAEQYLDRARALLEYVDIPNLKAQVLLLQAGLQYHQKNSGQVIRDARQALEIAGSEKNLNLEKKAHHVLYLGYEQSKQFDLALQHFKRYNALANIEQKQLNLISEEAFRQQKEFVEQTLHLTGQQQQLEKVNREYRKFQNIAFGLFIATILLLMIVLRRGQVLRRQKDEIGELNEALFTHSRSGLRNLRMLNAKLPASLRRSSDRFERWHIGELIHEPLNDRLRFVMIDVPFLRNSYLQNGYSEGMKLEKAFGDFIKEKLDPKARIYHFSDANLLYIEPNREPPREADELFQQFQSWIDQFRADVPLNRSIRVGMADYPFLPKAYTAINDKELLDLLLMATSAARTLSMKEHCSQWVYLKAIENAPAASLATGDIRKACKHAISQGLIKVHSSYQNEESIKKLLKDE